jgi:hypothetical protein
VRVVSGFLVNFSGTVVGFADSHRCFLRLDGLGEGVRVVMPTAALEPADRSLSRGWPV